MIINIALLVVIAITFYFQVKAFGQSGIMQWLPLVILGIVALTSFILKKKMNKESWFLEQQKTLQKSKEGEA
jgi:hypothetical protein